MLIQAGGGALQIRLARAPVIIDSSFKLYITSELACPVFPPEVSVHANLINFTITRPGLEA